MQKDKPGARFSGLIDELSPLLGIKVPPIKRATNEPMCLDLQIEGVDVSLLHMPVHDPDHFNAIYRFGAIPVNGSEVMKRALELNFLTAQSTGALLGIHPLTSEMMMSVRSSLLIVEPDALVESMLATVKLTKQWRQTYFLDKAPKPLKGVSTPMHGRT